MAFQFVTVERKGSAGNIFVITLQKPPENRLTVASSQELIKAYHSIQKELGDDSEGAVILTSSSQKFFTTVN